MLGLFFGLFCRDFFSSFLYLFLLFIPSFCTYLYYPPDSFCMISRFGSVPYFFSLLTDSHSWRDSGNERFGENKPPLSSQLAPSPTHCSHTGAVLPWEKKKSKVVRRLPGGFSPFGQTCVITIMVWGKGDGCTKYVSFPVLKVTPLKTSPTAHFLQT